MNVLFRNGSTNNMYFGVILHERRVLDTGLDLHEPPERLSRYVSFSCWQYDASGQYANKLLPQPWRRPSPGPTPGGRYRASQ